MITHFVSWPYSPLVDYTGGPWRVKIRGFVHFSNFICVTYCDLACFRHLWLVLDGIRLFVDGCRCFRDGC